METAVPKKKRLSGLCQPAGRVMVVCPPLQEEDVLVEDDVNRFDVRPMRAMKIERPRPRPRKSRA